MSATTPTCDSGTSWLRPRRQRACLTSWRGHLWALVIMSNFYLLSNPLVFEPVFDISAQRAVVVTSLGIVASIPWLVVPRVHPILVVFLVWGVASAFWSIQPAATILTAGLYLTLAAVAVMTYAQVTGGVLALGFTYGGLLVTAMSLYAYSERLPGAYYDALAGPVLAGVGTNQNILAYTVTLAICGWLALWPVGWWRTSLWLATGVVLIYAVYLAQSTTGYLTAAITCATAAMLWSLSRLHGRFALSRLRRWTTVAGASVAGCVLALAVSGHGPGTFSDRMPFWRAALSVAADQPLLGYGWGAVWAHPWLPAPGNTVAESIYASAGLFLTHGHNSFVDLLIDVGTVGVVLIAVLVVSIVKRAVRPGWTQAVGVDDAVRSRFAVLCIVNLLIFGITEPLLVVPIGFWALVLLSEPAPDRVRRSKRSRSLSG